MQRATEAYASELMTLGPSALVRLVSGAGGFSAAPALGATRFGVDLSVCSLRPFGSDDTVLIVVQPVGLRGLYRMIAEGVAVRGERIERMSGDDWSFL